MDSYSPCPCGSGKKLKFCCQSILPEMARIERLQENNQHRMALQQLDKLRKDHPDNAWVVTQRAMLLLQEGELAEARDSLVAFLRKQSEHPLANVLLAMVVTESEPMEKAKKVIHRAFLKSMDAEPRLCSMLATTLMAHFAERQEMLALRQHILFGLRLPSTEKQQQELLLSFMQIEGDYLIPYPLRGMHELEQYEPPAAQAIPDKKALKLTSHGCFNEAADHLEQILPHDPQSAALRHNIALLRAWDADNAAAAQHFREAARLTDDFDRAVRWELMAQLLEPEEAGLVVGNTSREYRVESVARLLTRLDNDERLWRDDLQRSEGVEGKYIILDRIPPAEGDESELLLDDMPELRGSLTVFSATEEFPPVAILAAETGAEIDFATQLFESIGGELIARQASEGEGVEDEIRANRYLRLEADITGGKWIPPNTSAARRRQFLEQSRDRTIRLWLERPQPALLGKSPVEAAGDASLRVPLAAALHVLDAIFDRRQFPLFEQRQLAERLQVPLPQPPSPERVAERNPLNVMESLQVDWSALDDETFARLMPRALISRHARLSYEVLKEYLERRSGMMEKDEKNAAESWHHMARLCTGWGRYAEAAEWLERGYQWLKARATPYEDLLRYRLQELGVRSQDPGDPGLKQVLLELWNTFGAKVPSLRPQLEQFVDRMGISPPWRSAILTPEAAGIGGGWSADPAPAERKLWLPE